MNEEQNLQEQAKPALNIASVSKSAFISPRIEMPKPSEKNRYFSEKLMLLVGKRKYKGVYSFHFKRFYKDGFHTENYIFEIDKVDGWRLL